MSALNVSGSTPPAATSTARTTADSSSSSSSRLLPLGSSSLPINVVGAGLAGCMAALLLARQGHSVRLLELRGDIRTASETYKDDVPGHLGRLVLSNRRSVNLALSHRGIEALKAAGLFERLQPRLIPMLGRVMHDVRGALSYQPYGSGHQAIFSINRAELNMLLLDELDALRPAVSLLFETRVTRIDKDGCVWSGERSFPARFTIGADGAYSAVREAMRRSMRMDFAMSYISAGYKELHIPPTAAGEFALPHPHGLHIWPRREFMLIALPNPDRSFTCTLFAPFSGPDGLDGVVTEEQILAYFQRHFPDMLPVAPTLVADYQSSPTSALLSVRCSPWAYQDKVLLIGDAAHACVPFYGQGMNAAFEDCLLLSELYAAHGQDAGRAFSAFQQQRVAAGHALVDLSLDNFIEMRAKTASLAFLLRKRLEAALHAVLPRAWIPLYSMVAFTRLPYDECVARGRRQDAILRAAALGLAAAAVTSLSAASWWLWRKHGGGRGVGGGRLPLPAQSLSIG